jgi:hypothetical protein
MQYQERLAIASFIYASSTGPTPGRVSASILVTAVSGVMG